MLRVGSSRAKNYTQLSTQVPQIVFLHQNNKGRFFMMINYILMVYQGLEVGTLPPCGESLT